MADDRIAAKKKKKVIFVIVYNILFIAIALIILEFICLSLNKKSGEGAKPFLFNKNQPGEEEDRRQPGNPPKITMSYLDPHLGHARDPESCKNLSENGAIPGFVIFGNPNTAKATRIFVLGGSTTDPHDRNNWGKALYEICRSNRVPAVIYNGGVLGYSSNQEMLKLIRDVIPLNPDIVISLNGINDLGFSHALNEHPMVSKYQHRLMSRLKKEKQSWILPNTVAALRRWRKKSIPVNKRIRGFHLGPKVKTTPAKHWEKNIRIMHTISNEFGFHYLCFLQPTMGFGRYNPSAAEKAMFQEKPPGYIKKVEAFYNEARIRLKRNRLPFVVDLADIFQGKTNLYRDPRHPNAEGYRIIAAAIFKEIVKRELLKKEPPLASAVDFDNNNNLLEDAHDFFTKVWQKDGDIQVIPDFAPAPDGSSRADKIIFNNKCNLYQHDKMPVKAGEKVRASIWLWADTPSKIMLGTARHCSPKQFEGKLRTIYITAEPTQYEVTYTFEKSHNCARIQLISSPGRTTELYAWGAMLVHVETRPPK